MKKYKIIDSKTGKICCQDYTSLTIATQVLCELNEACELNGWGKESYKIALQD